MKQVGVSLVALWNASSSAGRSWPPRLFISAASSASERFSISRDTSPWSPISSFKPLAPGRAAGEHQRRVERVGAAVDPGLELVAARLLERRLLQRAVFHDDDVPAEILEQLLVALPQALAHDGVEALPVVVDDPPAIAQALLPAFEQRLEDVAFVEFGVADQRHHAALGAILCPSRARARSPAPATRTESAPRPGRPSRWRNRRRRRPWCAKDSSARPCSRGRSPCVRASACRADIGWRGRSARHAASPRRGPAGLSTSK